MYTTHAHPQYRVVLVALGFLTILSLGAATATFMASPKSSDSSRELKTSISINADLKPRTALHSNEPITAVDLRQFNRQLQGISLGRTTEEPLNRPIPYHLKEEGQSSIIYFYGDVHLRCWLELTKEKIVTNRCQSAILSLPK